MERERDRNRDRHATDVSHVPHLGNGRPVGVLLDALSQKLVLQHVHSLEVGIACLENLRDSVGEAALRKVLVALHEQNYFVVFHDLGPGPRQLFALHCEHVRPLPESQ